MPTNGNVRGISRFHAFDGKRVLVGASHIEGAIKQRKQPAAMAPGPERKTALLKDVREASREAGKRVRAAIDSPDGALEQNGSDGHGLDAIATVLCNQYGRNLSNECCIEDNNGIDYIGFMFGGGRRGQKLMKYSKSFLENSTNFDDVKKILFDIALQMICLNMLDVRFGNYVFVSQLFL